MKTITLRIIACLMSAVMVLTTTAASYLPPDQEVPLAQYESGILSNEDNNEIRKTVTLELSFIPWEMPWTNGEMPQSSEKQVIPASGSNIELTVYRSGGALVVAHNNATITVEIEVVDSLDDIPFAPGETRVFTDEALIYVISDELVKSRGTHYPITHFQIFDFFNPLIWYGRISIMTVATYEGVKVLVDGSQTHSQVNEKPGNSDLRVTKQSILNNPSALVKIVANWKLTSHNGTSTFGGSVTLNLDKNGNYW